MEMARECFGEGWVVGGGQTIKTFYRGYKPRVKDIFRILLSSPTQSMHPYTPEAIYNSDFDL